MFVVRVRTLGERLKFICMHSLTFRFSGFIQENISIARIVVLNDCNTLENNIFDLFIVTDLDQP